MKQRYLSFVMAAATAGLAALSAPSVAQDDPALTKAEDEIVVYPYGAPRRGIGRAANGSLVQPVSLARLVTTEGLDLRYDEDVSELRRRIADTAEITCDEVEDLVGPTVTTDRECVRQAVRGAMPQADALVARARY